MGHRWITCYCLSSPTSPFGDERGPVPGGAADLGQLRCRRRKTISACGKLEGPQRLLGKARRASLPVQTEPSFTGQVKGVLEECEFFGFMRKVKGEGGTAMCTLGDISGGSREFEMQALVAR